MRTEMVIRMETGSEKGYSKAMKVTAAIDGVESVTVAGEGRNLLRVVGVGVDSNYLTTRLRRKVGHADIVELRTLQDRRLKAGAGSGVSYYPSQAAAYGYGQYSSYSPAPASQYYHHHPYDYYPAAPPPYGATTVVHHDYPTASDPNNCSIM